MLLVILKNIDMYGFKLWFWLHHGTIYFGKMQANTADAAATVIAETSKLLYCGSNYSYRLQFRTTF